jgi:hypothetical protein
MAGVSVGIGMGSIPLGCGAGLTLPDARPHRNCRRCMQAMP